TALYCLLFFPSSGDPRLLLSFPTRRSSDLLAQAYGIPAARVDRPSQLDAALEEALNHPGPYLLDVRVRPEENCWPMVPAGGAIRSEEHTSELQSRENLVCRLLLEKKKNKHR